MMRTSRNLSILAVAVASVLEIAPICFSQSSWTPPPPRNDKTPLAPKPHRGHNIFKGDAEVWLADAIEDVEGGWFTPIKDQAVSQYVSSVGAYVAVHSVAPARRYQFIVTSDTCPDAFSLGGGRIYITLGMLKLIESEDELAGTLAHEIAHDAFGHTGKTVTRQMFWMTGTKHVETPEDVKTALTKLLAAYQHKPIAKLGETILGFSRFDELEADRAAFYNAYKAGYNPLGLGSALNLLAKEEKERQGKGQYWRDEMLMLLFANHPPNTQRLLALSWESNFVKMPPRDSRFQSFAFDAMKTRLRDAD